MGTITAYIHDSRSTPTWYVEYVSARLPHITWSTENSCVLENQARRSRLFVKIMRVSYLYRLFPHHISFTSWKVTRARKIWKIALLLDKGTLSIVHMFRRGYSKRGKSRLLRTKRRVATPLVTHCSESGRNFLRGERFTGCLFKTQYVYIANLGRAGPRQ